ncbi:hypothetical protein BMR11_16335 [Methylococcaceae bacterium CS5]|nr:hypothetical protein BMR11_16335 [Methylococcaceae bacterium CS5]TXL02619.1 hypothetical protein BMR09_16520 [Methylococcaceae bacterium CS3]
MSLLKKTSTIQTYVLMCGANICGGLQMERNCYRNTSVIYPFRRIGDAPAATNGSKAIQVHLSTFHQLGSLIFNLNKN